MKRLNIKTFWLEILILIAIILIVARYIWAKELIQFENAFIESLGFDSGVKYFIIVPLLAFLYYRLYKRESLKAKNEGQKIIGTSVIVFSIFSLILVICLLIFLVLTKNT